MTILILGIIMHIIMKTVLKELTIINFAILVFLDTIIPNLCIMILYHKTPEFIYMKELLISIIWRKKDEKTTIG